jgi:hypothetical protein
MTAAFMWEEFKDMIHYCQKRLAGRKDAEDVSIAIEQSRRRYSNDVADDRPQATLISRKLFLYYYGYHFVLFHTLRVASSLSICPVRYSAAP